MADLNVESVTQDPDRLNCGELEQYSSRSPACSTSVIRADLRNVDKCRLVWRIAVKYLDNGCGSQ
jgi:hypothetical protein